MSPARYLRHWLRALLAIAALFSMFTAAVDPYDLWGMPRIAGFNAYKERAIPQVRTIKQYQLARIEPRTVIIGNSRTEVGLDPASACWPQSMRPVYNYSIPGDGPEMQIANAQRAMHSAEPEYLVVALDFTDYLSTGPRQSAMPLPTVTEKVPALLSITSMRDRAVGTFSVTALIDSILTIVAQRSRFPGDLTAAGFNNAGGYARVVHFEGQKRLFDFNMNALAQRFPAGRWYFDLQSAGTRRMLEQLDQLMTAAAGSGIDTILFINPLHQAYLDLLERNGYGSEMRAWLREITVLANSHSVVLWDFSGRHPTTANPTRESSDGSLSAWFWEPSHYRAALGDMVLSTMFGQCAKVHRIAGFGTLLGAGDAPQPGR